MRRILFVLVLLAASVLVWGQGYQPKPGETILKLSVANRGDIYIQLHTAEAPNATSQIARLVEDQFYDRQTFYRVDKEPVPFLIQTGDPQSKELDPDDPELGSGGSGNTVAYEDSGFPSVAGAVGLATQYQDPDSGDSQFFILLSDKPYLARNYTIFGKVVAGMDVVRQVERGDRIESAVILRG
jgi:cyclophilin family peptidyl-prolyl cis-trans isomerase